MRVSPFLSKRTPSMLLNTVLAEEAFISVRAAQPSKAVAAISVVFAGIDTDLSDLQLRKALSPIVSAEPIITDTSDESPAKALLPMFETPLPRIAVAREVIFENAPLPISVTLSGTLTVAREAPAKAFSLMVLTLSGIEYEALVFPAG